jgi:uncharacterized protein
LKINERSDTFHIKPFAIFIGFSFFFAILFNLPGFTILPSGLPAGWNYMPAALGPFLGYLAANRFLKYNVVKMYSGPLLANLIIWLLPVGAFSVTGLSNDHGINPHFYAFIYGIINAIYALFEESGWRGFLNNALHKMKDWQRYLVTGLIWWLWHMRFQNVFDWVVFPLIILASAFALGKLADTYRSFMVSAGFHLLIILGTNTGGDGNAKILAAVICIVGWIVMFRILKARKIEDDVVSMEISKE